MLDIELFRKNPQVVVDSQKRRGQPVELVEEVTRLDEKWREYLQQAEKLKHERNVISENINRLKKAGKSADAEIKQMKDFVENLKEIDQKAQTTKMMRDKVLLEIPNILDKRVPAGKSDEDNKIIRVWGKIPKFKFKPKDHIDLGLTLDLFDVDKAAGFSGARFYFLKNKAVLLNQALARYAIDFLVKEGHTPLMPPNLIRGKVLQGAGYFPGGEQDAYKIENEDLYLIGTSEQIICAFHSGETLKENELPKKYAGYSPCYRTEAGSHGRDTKGIFRVHQFEKVEQVRITTPEMSEKAHQEMIGLAEKLFKSLGISYHVVINCTADIGYAPAAMKYDLEAWLPGQNKYREMVSCSNCTDYQARRLGVRVLRKNGKIEVAHILNSTAFAIERTMIAIMENFQQADGSIKIPKVLWKYTGFREIRAKK